MGSSNLKGQLLPPPPPISREESLLSPGVEKRVVLEGSVFPEKEPQSMRPYCVQKKSCARIWVATRSKV